VTSNMIGKRKFLFLSFFNVILVQGKIKKSRRTEKPEVEAKFNFLPDMVNRRNARDATLSVLDLFRNL